MAMPNLEAIRHAQATRKMRRPDTVTPPGFHLVKKTDDGYHVARRIDQLSVIVTEAVELDGKWWRHVSVAKPDRLPTYTEMVAVKEAFIGADRKALSVLPARSEHVNLHPFCLHLWWCCDGDPLPDFTAGTGSI